LAVHRLGAPARVGQNSGAFYGIAEVEIMRNRQLAWVLAVVVLAIVAYLVLRPPGNDNSGSSQPSPHAIDQSQ
jgi:uncharacterized membrane protein YfcA